MTRAVHALPWVLAIMLLVLGRITGFAAGAMAWASWPALAAEAITYGFLRRRGWASQIDLGLVLFCALYAAGFSLWPSGLGALLATMPLAALYLSIFLVIILTPLMGGETFTTHFAKRTTPEAVWDTDVFRTINRNMSLVWALLFLAAGAVTWLAKAMVGPQASLLAITLAESLPPMGLMLGIGLPFTKWYPAHYQRRLGIEPLGATEEKAPTDTPPAPAASKAPEPAASYAKESVMSEKPFVAAVVGSPHQAIGNTTMMVEMLRPGLESQGFDLEMIQLCDKHIEYCVGCAHCLEKGRCWIPDDHRSVADRLLAADGIILASPVYFFSVTGQMKTFLDRSLTFGHKPRTSWKPGLAVSVSAGGGETGVANYLGQVMRAYGAFCVGTFTAIAVQPGGFIGQDAVRSRADDLARDLAVAIKEKRRYPATDNDLGFWHFMSSLVKAQGDGVMADDHRYWSEHGLYDSFEAYVGQKASTPARDPEQRRAWIRQMMADYKAGQSATKPGPPTPAAGAAAAPGQARGPAAAKSLHELLEIMPQGLNRQAAQGVEAVYQFEVSGDEDFTAHLVVSGGECSFHEGPADKPGVVIKTPADVWLAVSRGELDGQSAFMSGKYKTEGDITLLMKLSSLFKP